MHPFAAELPPATNLARETERAATLLKNVRRAIRWRRRAFATATRVLPGGGSGHIAEMISRA
jgi:hypothetical protein